MDEFGTVSQSQSDPVPGQLRGLFNHPDDVRVQKLPRAGHDDHDPGGVDGHPDLVDHVVEHHLAPLDLGRPGQSGSRMGNCSNVPGAK